VVRAIGRAARALGVNASVGDYSQIDHRICALKASQAAGRPRHALRSESDRSFGSRGSDPDCRLRHSEHSRSDVVWNRSAGTGQLLVARRARSRPAAARGRGQPLRHLV